MTRVLDDIKDYIDDLFHIDDIVEIYSIKFVGALSPQDIYKFIAESDFKKPKIIKAKIELFEDKIEGTHAYEIKLLDGSCINIPVW